MSIEVCNNLAIFENSLKKRIDWSSPNDGLKFYGTNTRVDVGTTNIPVTVAGELTFSFCIRFNDFTPPDVIQRIYHKGTNINGFSIWITNGGNLAVYIINANTNIRRISMTSASAPNLKLNRFYHCVITKGSGVDLDSFNFYINGRSVAKALSQSVGTIPAIATDPTPLTLGGQYNIDGTYNGHFNGILYDMQVYNRVATLAERMELYNKQNKSIPATLDANLLANWKFDSRQGTNVTDYKPSGTFHGTCVNYGATTNLGGGAWVDINGNTINQL
jgi:hypothetical protein